MWRQTAMRVRGAGRGLVGVRAVGSNGCSAAAGARWLAAMGAGERHHTKGFSGSQAASWLFRAGLGVVAGVSTCGLVYADVTDRTTLLRNAEQRYGTDPEGIYLALQDVVNDATLPEDELQGQLLWHFARACHDMAAELSNKEEKKRLIYEGYAAAERAVVYAPQVSAAHKWMAIMISDVGDFEGLKAKLLKSYTMKEHFQKAIELNPKDATSRHLLGVWCFSFADLPWYQRKAAAAVFATPPSSTYEEALANFEQAEATEPGFYTKNAYYLGLTYARLGRKEEARRWLETCLEMPANNADDKEAHTLAAAALKQV